MTIWSHETFSQLFKHDPREAFEYRLRTLGEPIPEEYLTEEEKNAVNVPQNEAGNGSPDKKELMELLRTNNVTFSPAATAEKLLEKAKQNNLA